MRLQIIDKISRTLFRVLPRNEFDLSVLLTSLSFALSVLLTSLSPGSLRAGLTSMLPEVEPNNGRE